MYIARPLRNLLAGAIVFTAPVQAQVFESYSFNSNLAVPDGNLTGVSSVQSIASSGTTILSLNVSLQIAGDYNGDLYLQLRHGSGFSVLLNRPGRASGNSFGYDDSGFNITLSDSAAHDVHNYRSHVSLSAGSPLTGAWQPDGRISDPRFVLDSTARTAGLSSFNGLDASGQWTLHAVDASYGGINTVTTWGMEMVVVPEPAETAAAIGALLAGFALYRRCRARSAKARLG